VISCLGWCHAPPPASRPLRCAARPFGTALRAGLDPDSGAWQSAGRKRRWGVASQLKRVGDDSRPGVAGSSRRCRVRSAATGVRTAVGVTAALVEPVAAVDALQARASPRSATPLKRRRVLQGSAPLAHGHPDHLGDVVVGQITAVMQRPRSAPAGTGGRDRLHGELVTRSSGSRRWPLSERRRMPLVGSPGGYAGASIGLSTCRFQHVPVAIDIRRDIVTACCVNLTAVTVPGEPTGED
jgi:hypothetical protein